MLIGADERFLHQVSQPHAMVGCSDPSWRERYWVSFQDVEAGDTVLTLGIGQYPNQDVQEAFACVHDGSRHLNVRMARRLSPRRDEMRVGPMLVEVVEPYGEIRFVLDENESDLAFEIDWTSSFPPILEDRHIETSGARTTHDLTRYVQVGRAGGRLKVGDREIKLTTDRWWGARDHSWGLRPLPAVEGSPPTERPEWRFLLFLPVQFEDMAFHMYLFEDADGRPTHLSGGAVDASSSSDDRIRRVDHALHWEAEALTPTLVGGTVEVELVSGRSFSMDLEARPGRAFLRAGGYGGYKGWFQGHWKGEESLEHEVWDLTEFEKLRARGASSSDHLVRVVSDHRIGHGIAEYMVLPGHHRYGHVRA